MNSTVNWLPVDVIDFVRDDIGGNRCEWLAPLQNRPMTGEADVSLPSKTVIVSAQLMSTW